MDDKFRFGSTAFIWVAYVIVMLGMFAALSMGAPTTSGPLELGIIVFALCLTAVAGFSTFSVWRPGNNRTVTQQARSDAIALGKVKRIDTEQISRLVESLSDDDIIELETLLLAHQDERAN